MKSLKAIQTVSKIGKILSKIAFVFFIIGACCCVVGMLSLVVDSTGVIKMGGSAVQGIKIYGVTVHGLLSDRFGLSSESIAATLFGWLIICIGQAVLSKFAEKYFMNELKAGTPFTLDGASELLRLGIMTIAVPIGCSVAAGIAEGIIASFSNAAKSDLDTSFDNESSVVLGVMFIIISLLCRYGAELNQNNASYNSEK